MAVTRETPERLLLLVLLSHLQVDAAGNELHSRLFLKKMRRRAKPCLEEFTFSHLSCDNSDRALRM